MNIEIHAKPIFWLEMTLEQAELLSKAAKMHYDGTCISAAERGGFIYGWINHLIFADVQKDRAEPAKVQGDFHNLDICLKILEMTIGLTTEEKVMAGGIRNAFHRALVTANEEMSKILISLE